MQLTSGPAGRFRGDKALSYRIRDAPSRPPAAFTTCPNALARTGMLNIYQHCRILSLASCLISLTSILPRVSCLIHRLIHLCFPGNRARSPASLKRAAESKLARLCGRDIVGLSPPYHSPLEDYQRRDEARGLKVDYTCAVPLRHLHFNETFPRIIATPTTTSTCACAKVPCLASRTSCLRDRHNTPP